MSLQIGLWLKHKKNRDFHQNSMTLIMKFKNWVQKFIRRDPTAASSFGKIPNFLRPKNGVKFYFKYAMKFTV
jgi:hypothetical protein